MFRPPPPWATGVERKAGSQVNSPQYANSTEVASAVAHSVMRANGGRNRVSNDVEARERLSQICGSSTLRCTHTVNTAGSTPVRNNQRHPKRGSTMAVTTAASIYPMAHPDCISPMALARFSGGQLSATSTAPADHSPPSPSPISARQNNSVTRPLEVADPAEASE